MLQCESSSSAMGMGMGGGGPRAAYYLLLYRRMVRTGEVLALVALVSWSSWYVPSAVAAALRLAGSLLLNARFVFVLGNAIVLLLFALSRHDGLSSSSTSSIDDQSSTGTATPPLQQQAASSSVPVGAASATNSFPAASFITTPTTTIPAMEAPREAVVIRRADTVLLFEDKQQQAAAAVAARAVNANANSKLVARAPRRSRSGKMGSYRRAASPPELRRCESENGRRRSSVNAESCRWGREDADEFRRTVEAFIARQTRFHREESIKSMRHCEPAPAFTAALAVVE